MIRKFLRHLRKKRAQRRLSEIVEQTRNSFEIQLYIKNRSPQIKRRGT